MAAFFATGYWLPTTDYCFMKIVRIIARLNVGGPARHVVWLTAGLRNEEYESMLVAGTVPPGEDDMGYFAEQKGVHPVVIPEMSREISPKDALTIWKLYRLLKRERPDVVHTHTAKAGTVGRVSGLLYRWATPSALIGRPRRCRFVHTYHGHIFHSYYGPLKTRIFLGIERWLARIATDKIIVISPQQYHEIHEQFGVGRPEQFTIIPLGLDTDAFSDRDERRQKLRDELNAANADVLVGIVGRLTEVKNHELFLSAVALYKERHGLTTAADGRGRVRFVLIGDGHLRRGLEEQALALGLGDEVVFLGTRDDPENFYAALDLVALTSRNEGTPLTLIEAMATARPCVATAVGGVVDLLGETVAPSSDSQARSPYTIRERGILVRPNDPEAFCEGLARLIEDESLRREMGRRGRSFVESNYSKERLLADIMGLYRQLGPHQQAAAGSGVWSHESGVKRLSSDS
jgi:glycosyltransferase involved in cell wall biosynthesis